MRTGFLLFSGLLLAWGAEAASLAEGERCLRRNDVVCAEQAVEALSAKSSSRADLLHFAAETSFAAGRFDEAAELYQRAVDAGWEDRYDDLALYRRTAAVTQDWTRIERGEFVVRYRPGLDAVLLDDALGALEGARTHISPLLGGDPPGLVPLEVYPDASSFIDASSLTATDVRTTGVVALSKWSRLLLTSPRALGRGYGWQDTVAHEYVHLVVSYHTDDRAPVWLQEAIAKYLDNRWRDGKDHFRLTVHQQGLVKDALASGEFVSFEQMHPSLAKLPSADMAALAYAQLATLMAYSFERGGEDVLVRALPAVRAGTDPREALARAAGAKDFAELEKGWRVWITTLELLDRNVSSMPTVLDGGDEVAADPVLSHREDLARFVRLGDLLAERDHYQAALVEYAKAVPTDEPQSPLLSNRVAQAYLALGDMNAARAALEQSLVDYPDFPLTHKTLGAIRRRGGQARAAAEAYVRSVELNPFDREVQEALADLYAELGDAARAARHSRYVQILKRGGEG